MGNDGINLSKVIISLTMKKKQSWKNVVGMTTKQYKDIYLFFIEMLNNFNELIFFILNYNVLSDWACQNVDEAMLRNTFLRIEQF